VRALALLSGGLDSMLAIKLILDQGIDVVAINFTSPFSLCDSTGYKVADVAKRFNIPLKIINKDREYLEIVKNPKYGYGKNMNPCIDCRIFMLKLAKNYAKKIGASFIITGEVLDERPMSQTRKALNIIEKEVNLLKIGRHFRFGNNKIIVGRNEEENKRLFRMKRAYDYCFEVPGVGSPLTILQGPKTRKAIEKAAALTARYSDAKGKKVLVKYGSKKMDKSIKVSPMGEEEIENLRVG